MPLTSSVARSTVLRRAIFGDPPQGLCHVPAALAGTTFQIGRFSGEPIVFEDWDGQPFELP